MVLGELAALLTSEMLPDALLVAVGANCTLKVLDCPAATVSGKVSPLMLKPAPVTGSCAMVRLAPPEFVKVRFCTPVLPTSTLDRKSVVEGKGVDLGGRRIIKKKKWGALGRLFTV